MDFDTCSNWLEIDLGAIRNNVARMRQLTGVMVMAVVKANGYGHGQVQVAQAALEGGAQWCGVARMDEALNLRQNGVTAPTLVTSNTSPQRVEDALSHNVTLTVYDADIAREYSSRARALNGRVRVHAKIDTSMGRLGVLPHQALDFLKTLKSLPGLDVEGIFTHFAVADEPGRVDTDQAIDRFEQVLAELRAHQLCPPLVHACNSAGALNFPRARYDLVRPGIAIYGLHPAPEAPLPETFRPALTWKTHVDSVKILPAGHGISYGSRYVTQRAQCVGALGVGYADGLRRRLGNHVLVRGKRVPVVGNVCMDQCMILLDDVPEAQMGDEVVLLGRQGEDEITAEELGREWGTVNYEVVCGLAARVPRFYFNA